MKFIFSIPVLTRHLWQSKTVVFLHWCLLCTVPLSFFNQCATLFLSMFAIFKNCNLIEEDLLDTYAGKQLP